MKIAFELRKEKISKSGLVPVQLVVRSEGIRIRKNTGVSTEERYWNGARINPSGRREAPNNHQLLNDELQKIEQKANDIFFYFRANKIQFSKEKFLEIFNSKTKNTQNSFNFFDAFDEFIKAGELTKTKNTIKSQTTVKNYLIEFQKHLNSEICFEKIDMNFFEILSQYSYSEKKIDNNYFAKIISILKTVLRWSSKRGYHNNFKYVDFKASEYDIDIVYLTFDELSRLYNFKFNSERLESVRDAFCFGCFTGLRFSDLEKLKYANISNDHITLSIQKNKTQNHIIKLSDPAKSILNKYKGTPQEPLPIISAQNFNKYIKECCKLAEIDTAFTTHWYRGREKNFKTQPKYELISSHQMRKTFITNSLILGMEPKAIKKIANIKKDAVLDKYLKITEEYADNQMEKAWNRKI